MSYTSSMTWLAERYDIKSNVKLGGFRSQLRAAYVSSHIKVVVIQRNSRSVNDYIYIYIYMFLCS